MTQINVSKVTKHKAGTAWNENDKRRALAVYKSLGSMVKTTEITGIPDQTLRFWMKQEWWKEGLLQLKAEDSAELEDAATSIAKMGGDIVKERLQHGDFVLNKDGELIRKPVGARDAAVITAIAIDKRKVLQEEPIREQQLGSTERLLKLVEQFARFASSKEIKGVVKEIDIIEETKDKDAIEQEL
jgi:transposase-like protein